MVSRLGQDATSRCLLAFALLVPATHACLASATSPGDEPWTRGFGRPGADGSITAAVVYRGQLVVGGSFLQIGDQAIASLAAWDGTQWQPIGGEFDPERAAPRITALYARGDDLFVAGGFSQVGRVPAANVARWDGTHWYALGDGLDAAPASFVDFNGTLIAAGGFTHSGPRATPDVAQWDGASWAPLGVGMDYVAYSTTAGWVRALAVYEDELIAAGTFNRADQQVAWHIARWDGQTWRPLGQGLRASAPNADSSVWVDHLAVWDGLLVAAGDFELADGQPVAGVAGWDGAQWSPLGGRADFRVTALSTWGARLLAGARTSTGDFDSRTGLLEWSDGNWIERTRFVRRFAAGNSVGIDALTVWDGRLVVGGGFRGPQEVDTNCLALWDGVSWSGVEPSLSSAKGIDGTPYAVGTYRGHPIVAGWLGSAGGHALGNIAEWDGTDWRMLGAGSVEFVAAMVEHQDKLFATGAFRTVGSSNLIGPVASWDGSLWSPLVANESPGAWDGLVLALTEHRDDLVAGGGFTHQPSGARNIVLWNGSTWRSTDVPAATSGRVRALCSYEGWLVAGGDLWMGSTAGYLLRWDGHAWQGFPGGVNGPVFALCSLRGSLVVGGSFTAAGGVSVNGIARWDGQAWYSLGSGVGGVGESVTVTALAGYGPDLVAGGKFVTVAGSKSPGLARWIGTVWTPFGSGLRPAPTSVSGLAQVEGSLLVVGSFDRAGTGSSYGVARYDGEQPPPDAASTIDLTCGEVAGPARALIDAPIRLNAAPATWDPGSMLQAIDLALKWDPPSIAGVVEVRLSPELSDWQLAWKAEAGRLRVSATGLRAIGPLRAAIDLLAVHWQLGPAPGAGTIRVESAQLYDPELEPIGYRTTGGSMEVMCLRGDLDADGRVDPDDASAILARALAPVGSSGGDSCAADFDSDGRVTVGDAVCLLSSLRPPPGELNAKPLARLSLAAGGDPATAKLRLEGCAGARIVLGYDALLVTPRVAAADRGLLASDPRAEGRWALASADGRVGVTELGLQFGPLASPSGLAILEAEAFDGAGRPLRVSLPDTPVVLSPSAAGPSGQTRLARRLEASPNPFQSDTSLRFGLEVPGPIEIRIIDAAGRLVRTLPFIAPAAGVHELRWDARDQAGRRVASGVYRIQLASPQGERRCVVVLVR